MEAITFDQICSAIVAGLALIYIIVICANRDRSKRSLRVCWFLFIVNAGLVVTTAISERFLLFVLWTICLIMNGCDLKKDEH